jgi:hypothetical protein
MASAGTASVPTAIVDTVSQSTPTIARRVYPNGYGNPGNPNLYLSGDNMVGGKATAVVTAAGGATITSVTWNIVGAVKGQDYTNASGAIIPLGNTANLPVSGPSTGISFYWNATPGNHAVTVTVTYGGMWSGSGSASVNTTVVQPTVSRFVLDSYGLNWDGNLNSPQAGPPGFMLSDTQTSKGFSLGATVSLPATARYPGNFGFIQLISTTITITNQNTGVHTMSTGGYVLDNNPQYNTPNGAGWLGFGSWNSLLVPPGGSQTITEWTIPGAPIDAPQIPTFEANAGGSPDPAIEIEWDASFADWLIYHTSTPDSGLWVGLAITPLFSVHGHEQFNTTTQTWSPVGTQSPSQPGVIVTGFPNPNGPQFVNWTNYMTNFNYSPPYPTPPWGQGHMGIIL